VRISFCADHSSWSALGRDALNTGYFPLHQLTMNFGWVRDDSDPVEGRAVVLHEFGHALGCVHDTSKDISATQYDAKSIMLLCVRRRAVRRRPAARCVGGHGGRVRRACS